jgi:hypothetical protein
VNIVPVDPSKLSGWDDSISSHPDASVFHTAAWARVLSESYGYHPCYLQSAGTDGILPLMEVRSPLSGSHGVGLPFTDLAPPLASDPQAHSRLVAEAIAVGRRLRWKYLEIRGGCPVPGCDPPSVSYIEHVLGLDRPETEIFRKFRTNMKRNVDKANAAGITVSFSSSADAVDAYYALHCRTRRMHGLPPQPILFFHKIREHLLDAGKGFVALAKRGEVPVAGAVFLGFGKRMVYKFGASDETGRGTGANILLMWESIRKGIRDGFGELSMGRTDSGQAGLIAYKKGFGTEERALPYYRIDPETGVSIPAPSLGSNRLQPLFRHLPIPVSRAIGGIFYRYMG